MKPRKRARSFSTRWILLVGLLLGGLLLGLIAYRTLGALRQVDANIADRGVLLTHTLVNAIRGVARYGPERQERVQSVLNEVVGDQVLSAALLDEQGQVQAQAGRTFETPTALAANEHFRDLGDQRALVAHDFSLQIGRKGHGGGWGRGLGHPSGARRENSADRDRATGEYRLVLTLDNSQASVVREHIVNEAVALAVILLAFGGALLLWYRSLQRTAELQRSVLIEQQRRESLESLNLLGAGLAHELRNPLGAIRGTAQLLSEEQPEGAKKEHVVLMLGELDRMSDRLAEFLSFARERTYEPQVVDLVELVSQVVSLLSVDTESSKLSLNQTAEPATIEAVVDSSQIKEAVLNVVLNAIQASGDGGTVDVSVRGGKTEASISVADKGNGIDASDLLRIFEPYYTTRSGGSGLGLPIARRIAERHGGTVEVESSSDGTVVTLALPLSPQGREEVLL